MFCPGPVLLALQTLSHQILSSTIEEAEDQERVSHLLRITQLLIQQERQGLKLLSLGPVVSPYRSHQNQAEEGRRVFRVELTTKGWFCLIAGRRDIFPLSPPWTPSR